MTNEEKQFLKLEDLSARLLYGVCVAKGNIIYPITGINVALGYVELAVSERISIEEVKYYLRPMESMTEKERKEFDKFCVIDELAWKGGNLQGYINQAGIIQNGIKWLLKHHFDYRGLIKLGLALEAPKGMYNF